MPTLNVPMAVKVGYGYFFFCFFFGIIFKYPNRDGIKYAVLAEYLDVRSERRGFEFQPCIFLFEKFMCAGALNSNGRRIIT